MLDKLKIFLALAVQMYTRSHFLLAKGQRGV